MSARRQILPGRLPAAPERYDRDNEQIKRRIIELLRSPRGGLGASLSVQVQRFSTYGTHTWHKPPGAVVVDVYAVGGGGGGGGGGLAHKFDPYLGDNRSGGRGGAGGTLRMARFLAEHLPDTVPVTVGIGGLGGSQGLVEDDVMKTVPGPGASGSESSFGDFVKAPGGAGGGRGKQGSAAPPLGPVPYATDLNDESLTGDGNEEQHLKLWHVRSAFLGIGGMGGTSHSSVSIGTTAVAQSGSEAPGGGGGGAGGNTTTNSGAIGGVGGGRIHEITQDDPNISLRGMWHKGYHHGIGGSALSPGLGGGGGEGSPTPGVPATFGGWGGHPGGGGGGGGGAKAINTGPLWRRKGMSGRGGKGGDGEVVVVTYLLPSPQPHSLSGHDDTMLWSVPNDASPVWNGTVWVPSFIAKPNHNHDAGAIVSGVINPLRLAPHPQPTKFLRGDGAWETMDLSGIWVPRPYRHNIRINSTSADVHGLAASGLVGTASATPLGPGSPLEAIGRVRLSTATSADSRAGVWVGPGPVAHPTEVTSVGESTMRVLFGFSNIVSGQRFRCFYGRLAGSLATEEPSSVREVVGIGWDSTDTPTLFFLHNDATGTCTKVSSGLTPQPGVLYELTVRATASSYVITLYAYPSDSPASKVVYTVTEDAMFGTHSSLAFSIQVDNVATGQSVGMFWHGTYFDVYPASTLT